jgi:ATP synthase protein I
VSRPPVRPPPRLAPIKMGRTAEAAWEASLSVVVGAVIGIFADKWLGTAPWLTIVFVVLGAAAAFRRLIRLAQVTLEDEQKRTRDGGGNTPQQ